MCDVCEGVCDVCGECGLTAWHGCFGLPDTRTELEADEMEVVGARDAEQEERDYEEYCRQLEGDKEMRKNVRASACLPFVMCVMMGVSAAQAPPFATTD